MPELRKDPVVGRWVIIASERARRPGNFVDRNDDEFDDEEERGCSLCDHQGETVCTMTRPPSSGDGPLSGDVRVVLSGGSVPSQTEFSRAKKGLYDVIRGSVRHEIIMETPRHVANMADLDVGQIGLVFEAYAARMRDLEKSARFQYILAYKNYGSTPRDHKIGHARSHIVATPVRPLRVKEKLNGAKKYFDAHQSCVYCDIVQQEMGTRERVIYETEHFLAVVPFASRFLFETWILPKRHQCDYHKGVAGVERDLAFMMKTLLRKLREGLDDPSYNFVVQTAPFRKAGGLYTTKWATIEKDYHWHIELMPRLTRLAGFEKGTGFYICPVPPEKMAEYLREVEI
jgi:UDPglucose--hexose-1-phosphate uridylyltransferase